MLDALLYHQSEVTTRRHHTDGGGTSEHVFALCAILGFQFAPRIPDLKHRRLYSFGKPSDHSALVSCCRPELTNWPSGTHKPKSGLSENLLSEVSAHILNPTGFFVQYLLNAPFEQKDVKRRALRLDVTWAVGIQDWDEPAS